MGGGNIEFWNCDGKVEEMVEDSEDEELEKDKMKKIVTNMLNKRPKSLTLEGNKRIDDKYNELSIKVKNRARHALGIEEKPLTPEELCCLQDKFDALIDEYDSESHVLLMILLLILRLEKSFVLLVANNVSSNL
ncbi:hypothetical protein FRX31_025531 [Thalictrum thalictroides]|uniref:Uncharacterized protein n=1 Tax=Thalictrum thalictroides TaxID=46969 RepID=A0A7J6VKM2_THATH|nr:hypothetical protein FRX31_025531 [Thalictrum thalictroides]